jgi:hypothetical protein
MTDAENVAGGTMSAGIDVTMDTKDIMQTLEDAKAASVAAGGRDVSNMVPVNDPESGHLTGIISMIHEVEAHIDLHDVKATASTWLANAKSALRSAIQYVEAHFAAVEEKAKAEVAKIETVFKIEGTADAASTIAAVTAATAASAD